MKAPRILPILPIAAALLASCDGKTPPPPGVMEGGKAGETRVFGGIEMVWCPPGRFEMGSFAGTSVGIPVKGLYLRVNFEGERGRGLRETPHDVALSHGFWLAKTETTQRQWEDMVGNNPSSSKAPELPVERVSWDDAREWLAEMNRRHPLPEGWVWELPTEAQWEYACRAGAGRAYSGGGLDEAGWHKGNSGGAANPVATKKANRWGLHDMHGNVWEWCRDWYDAYPSAATNDPTGPATGTERVHRGGGWSNEAVHCRSAYRNKDAPGTLLPNVGFRAAAVPPNSVDGLCQGGLSRKPRETSR